jgi:hypothetical protein
MDNNNEKMHIICIYLEPKYSCTKLEFLLNNLEKIYHDNSDDHPPLTCEYETSFTIEPLGFNRDYKKSDYPTINRIFSYRDWINLFNNNKSASGCVDTFYNLATKQ